MPAKAGGGGGPTRVRARPKPKVRARVRPVGVFAGPQVKAPSITAPARRKVARARERLPREHSFPRLPAIRHPSPQQATAIRKAGLKGLERHARERGLPGAESARRDLLARGDRETRRSVKALDRAQQVQAARRGRALGLRGSDKQVVRTLGAAELALRSRGAQVRPYKKPGRGVIATVNYPFAAASQRFGQQLASVGATGPGGRALQDIVSLPSAVVPAGYNTGAALVEAAQGRPGRAKQLAHEFTEHDPIALAAQGRFREAGESISEHPGLAALEVLGGVGSASRLAGRVARGGARPGFRPDRGAPGVPVRVREQRGKGLIASTRGPRRDRARIEKADRFDREGRAAREQAKQAEARGDYQRAEVLHAEADRLLYNARQDDPRTLREDARGRTGDLSRVADQREGLGQGARREHRDVVVRAGKAATERQGATLQALYNQGIVVGRDAREIAESATSYVRELEAQYPTLVRDEAKANRRLRAGIVKDLETADLDRLPELRKQYAAHARAVEEEAIAPRTRRAVTGEETGLLGREEARLARAKPFAVRQGARVEGRTVRVRPNSRGVLVRPFDKGEADARAGLLQAFDNVEREAKQKATAAETRGDDIGAKHYRELAAETARDRKAFEGEEGVAVTAGEIEAEMRARGVDPDEISFVTHQPGGLGARAFNVRWMGRKGVPTRRRSGRAVLKGTLAADRDVLIEQPTRLQGLIDADENFVRGIDEVAVKRPDGKPQLFAEKGQAQRALEELVTDENGDVRQGAVALRAIRVNPWQGRESQLRRLLEEADTEGFVLEEGGHSSHPVLDSVASAVRGEEGAGPWAIVPDEWARRIEDHALVVRSVPPALRATFSAFRKVVLPFSPTWFAGNQIEGAFRTAMVGGGPWSIRTFNRVIGEMATRPNGAAAVEELLHRATGGGQAGFASRQHIHSSAQQLSRSWLYPVARGLERLDRTPGTHQVAQAFRSYSDWVFWFNRKLETGWQKGVGGRYMRSLMPRQGLRVSQKAVEQAASGLMNTPEQVAMTRYVERAFGKWEGFSPEGRKWIAGYTPFAPWAVNAARFLLVVLPRDHPGIVAMLAANQRANETWLKEHGLLIGEEGALPPFLLGSVPAPKWYAQLTGAPPGSPVRLARFSPFGLGTDPGQTASSLFLPYLSGSLSGLQGQDWKGDPLPKGTNKYLYAAKQFAFATIPIIGIANRALLEKEGPYRRRALEILNPFQPVVPKKDRGGDAGSGREAEILKRIGAGGSSDEDREAEILKRLAG